MLFLSSSPSLHEEYRHINGEVLQKVTPVVEEGELRPLMDERRFTFDEVAQAHQYYEAGKAVGKIVLVNEW